jgi:hypothetical protein
MQDCRWNPLPTTDAIKLLVSKFVQNYLKLFEFFFAESR